MAKFMHLSPSDHSGILVEYTGFYRFLSSYETVEWLQDARRAIAFYLAATDHDAEIPQKIVERLTQIHSGWLYSLYDGCEEVH